MHYARVTWLVSDCFPRRVTDLKKGVAAALHSPFGVHGSDDDLRYFLRSLVAFAQVELTRQYICWAVQQEFLYLSHCGAHQYTDGGVYVPSVEPRWSNRRLSERTVVACVRQLFFERSLSTTKIKREI